MRKRLLMLISGLVALPWAANPITTALYTADPGALVYRDTLWIFTGRDADNATTSFRLNEWHLFSTTDMVNYQHHGSPLRPTQFPWASGNAFAAHVQEYQGKFYWFICASHRSVRVNEGFAIGVAVADHPAGPWVPHPNPLVTDETPNSIALNIDPATFVDDNGDIWLYWGSWGAARRVRLQSSMTAIQGNVQTVTAQGFFEAPWVHKYNGLYYLSYASGYPSTTDYATASSLAGPWTRRGVLNSLLPNSETNHQAIVRYLGHWYFIYHTGDAPGGHTYRRSVSVDYLFYNTDGAMRPIARTTTGPQQVNNAPIVDGYYKLRARHSNLVLEETADNRIVQNPTASQDRQLWMLTRVEGTRTYHLRNHATGRYLHMGNGELLAPAGTQVQTRALRIENSSVEDGYLLFADYEKDYVADVLNVSTTAGTELITYIRSGTPNQTFLLESADAPVAVQSALPTPHGLRNGGVGLTPREFRLNGSTWIRLD